MKLVRVLLKVLKMSKCAFDGCLSFLVFQGNLLLMMFVSAKEPTSDLQPQCHSAVALFAGSASPAPPLQTMCHLAALVQCLNLPMPTN